MYFTPPFAILDAFYKRTTIISICPISSYSPSISVRRQLFGIHPTEIAPVSIVIAKSTSERTCLLLFYPFRLDLSHSGKSSALIFDRRAAAATLGADTRQHNTAKHNTSTSNLCGAVMPNLFRQVRCGKVHLLALECLT